MGGPRKNVHPGHQPGVHEAPEQLFDQQDDGCDQEPRGYAQKLELCSLNAGKRHFLENAALFYVKILRILPYFLALFSYRKFILSP
jgi:hypothetical protein